MTPELNVARNFLSFLINLKFKIQMEDQSL